jgi:REP element-mobilizing transposase RayT
MIATTRSCGPHLPVRRTHALREHRMSIAGTAYFLTLSEARRRQGLPAPAITETLYRILDELHGSGDFCVVAATVMPDHIHMLGTLGFRLSLPRIVGKIKARTGGALEKQGLKWQENFYEHRLRPEDELESYVLYAFLNPYRAKIISPEQSWPCWWRWGEIRFRFESALESDRRVPAQWLGYEIPPGVSE